MAKKIKPSSLILLCVYLVLLFAFSVLTGFILLLFLNAPSILCATYNDAGLFWYVSGSEIIFGSLVLISFFNTMRKQYIHLDDSIWRHLLSRIYDLHENKTTYIQFIWFGFILAPLCIGLAGPTAKPFISLPLNFSLPYVLVISSSMFILGLAAALIRKDFDKEPQFAPGAITSSKDEFDFSSAASLDMRRLIENRKHILIGVVNGGMGRGKSSYLRMMVESLKPEKRLYTYISLTETNETTSFSELFADRWSETILERYPSIIRSARQSILDNITRETDDRWLHLLKALVHNPIWPLRRTAVRVESEYNYPKQPKKDYVPERVASIFSYVPYFYEKYWIVVVDEMERAPFQEIYRAIETIERFRMESQWGLPIKLIFIFCTSREDLKIRTTPFKSENEYAPLIDSFFAHDTFKSIDEMIDLPPISPSKKEQYVTSRIDRIVRAYKINTDALASEEQNDPLAAFWPAGASSPNNFQKGRWDDKKAYDYMMNLILARSPRFIDHVLENTDSFIRQFTRSAGERSADQIRISDLIMLQYLKADFPSALDFLYNVMPDVFPSFFRRSDIGIAYRQMVNKDKNEKLTFADLFYEKTGHQLEGEELRKVEELVSYICFPVLEYIKSLKSDKSAFVYENVAKPDYDRTLGLPENLWDALTIATDRETLNSEYLTTQRDEIYAHDHDRLPARAISSTEKLLTTARNMRRFYPGDFVVSRFLIQTIVKKFVAKRIIMRPSSIRPGSLSNETFYNSLTYALLFHLSNYVKRDGIPDDGIDWAFRLVKAFLESEKVLLEAKIILIDNLFTRRQPKSELEIDFARTRTKFEDRHASEIKPLIAAIVNHGLDQYSPKGSKTIYDYEENFFFVMYQLWDGDPSNVDNISAIARVAEKNLGKNRSAIDAYWDREKQSRESSALGGHSELPIKISRLIEITKKAGLGKRYRSEIEYWEARIAKNDVPQLMVPSREFDITLVQKLIQLGYI